jgi:hypothetical protein
MPIPQNTPAESAEQITKQRLHNLEVARCNFGVLPMLSWTAVMAVGIINNASSSAGTNCSTQARKFRPSISSFDRQDLGCI